MEKKLLLFLSLLLGHQSILHASDEDFKKTPFIKAILNNNLEEVQKYITSGHNINAISPVKGWGALHYAAYIGNPIMCEMFINAGLDPHAITTGSDTINKVGALEIAAGYGHDDVCRLFIEQHNISVNKHSRNTTTPTPPLTFAVRNGKVSTAKLLLEHGADPAHCVHGKFTIYSYVTLSDKGSQTKIALSKLLARIGTINGLEECISNPKNAEIKQALTDIQICFALKQFLVQSAPEKNVIFRTINAIQCKKDFETVKQLYDEEIIKFLHANKEPFIGKIPNKAGELIPIFPPLRFLAIQKMILATK